MAGSCLESGSHGPPPCRPLSLLPCAPVHAAVASGVKPFAWAPDSRGQVRHVHTDISPGASGWERRASRGLGAEGRCGVVAATQSSKEERLAALPLPPSGSIGCHAGCPSSPGGEGPASHPRWGCWLGFTPNCLLDCCSSGRLVERVGRGCGVFSSAWDAGGPHSAGLHIISSHLMSEPQQHMPVYLWVALVRLQDVAHGSVSVPFFAKKSKSSRMLSMDQEGRTKKKDVTLILACVICAT